MVSPLKVLSTMPVGFPLKLDSRGLEFCSSVYMCIKQVGEAHYSIPDNLSPIVHQILGGIYSLDHNIEDWESYCYITIKKGYIQPNSLGNRDGWHIDGFLSDQRNFIWSDCDATPTEVCEGEFHLTPSHDASLGEMLDQAGKPNHFIHQLKSGVLYELDQNMVHRPTKNLTREAVLRTFVKITFSRELFNCVGNAWNYKLPHIIPTVKRAETRNHTVL